MLRIFKTIFFLLCLFFSASVFSDPQTSVQLTNLLESIKTLQANFSQNIYDKNGSVLQQTTGKMSLQRPGKFRWDTKNPSQQLLVADGSHVWFYDIDLAQVMKQKQQTNANNSPAMLLSGSVPALIQEFKISRSDNDNPDEVTFKLVPRIKSDLFRSVELTFKNDSLSAMELMDNLNQATIIKFTNVKSNPELNAQLFNFVVPKGVSVVKQ